MHRHRETSWAELEAPSRPGGPLIGRFVVGDPDDTDGPLVMRVMFPPNYAVAPHTHTSDYTEIILEGSQQVTRRWHYPGDIRIVEAGTVYGPLIAGPDGVTVLFVFRSGADLNPRWVRPDEPTTTTEGYAATAV